jgi:CHAT domain-containing protein
VDRAEEHVVRFGYTGAWANRFRQRYRRAYELLLGLEVEAGHHGPAVDLLSQFQQMQIANLRHDALAAQAMPVPPPRLRGGNQPLSNELPPQGGPSASSTVARGKGEFFQALSSLRQKHPEYDALLAVRPVNYAQIQKWIPDDTAVVQFFPSTDTLYLFWVTARDFKIHKVNLGSQELKRRVSAFRRATTSPSMAQEAVEKASSELYQCLIQPVESELVPYSTVAFVPTGTLSYVPFQALGRRGSEGKFHYLVESKACLTLLKSAELELLSRPAPAAAGRVLALGDPDGSLPAAGVEAQKVAALFEGSKSYVGATASRDKVEGLPAQTRLLHLATHGQLDGDNPTQSYLVMGGAGRLCVADIYALPLAGVRLVTLSACQTALAQRDPGSEVTSLADAFEVAGANSVIATLWSVDDEATQQLMLAFYAQVKQGKSLAEALRAAQLELIGQGRTQAPFYWAAFCLYGDWR